MSFFDRFVRVSAQVLEWFDGDPIARATYLELCRRAEWKAPVRRVTKHGPVEVDLGQCYFGREEIAERVGHAERRVRASIERLKSSGAIAVKTSKLGSVATIVGLKEKLLEERERRPSERPSQGPTDVQLTSTTKIGDLGLPRSNGLDPVLLSPEPPAIVRADPDRARASSGTSWHRRDAWWKFMRAAHRRLRDRGIQPNAPDLPPQCAGVNETNMIACERSLLEAGHDAAEVDTKMRHVVLVAEAECDRDSTLRYFKPALIWDPARFNRAVDTSLEEAAQSKTKRVGPRRAGETIGASTVHKHYRTGRCLLPFDILELGNDAATDAYENVFLELEAQGRPHDECQRQGRRAALEAAKPQKALELEHAG